MISRREALDLFASDDLIAVGMKADLLRQRFHPYRIVSYCFDSEAVSQIQFDAEESFEERLDRLQGVRDTQSIGVMPCFKQGVSAVEYLKTLAISRLYLDEVVHVQTSWKIGGLKLCQIALRFGANDICGRPDISPTEEDLRRVIRDAGFTPKQRDTLFQSYSLD